ncbi:MAG: PEP-CTERM sorting domain-containing protein [Planctomycetota bacterium]|nr:PEP-CTERM sorting domain-containing protein [Planctomycetota bacterium]
MFRQEGGACQIDGNLNLGEWYGGRYEMAGGTLATGHTLVNKATFQQAAGSHTVGVLEVTALGRYELGADTLTVTGSWANAGQMDFLSAAGRVVVADNGFVDFRGGSILNCANASMSLGTNSYMLAPVGFDPQVAFHSFQTGGIVHVAGTTMSVPDGYNLTFSGSLDDLVDCRGKLSSEPGKALNLTNGLKLRTSGVVNLENGTLTVTGSTSTTSGQLKAAYIHVGPNPTAKLTQTIGSVQATWNVQVGAGAYVMNGTGTLDASQLVLGGEGDGYFTQNNGYLTVEGGAILIGDAAGSGTYQLVNGSSSSYGVYIGGCPDFYGKPQKGDGHWVQSGGTATTNYVTVRGVVHDATVDVSGGTMMARNMIASGINGTWGVFRQTGGVVSAADSDYYQGMTLGDVTGEQGRYELSGTGLLHASNLFVGLEGTGAFQQTGGAVTVSDKLGIGFWYSAQGDYRMDGGTLTVQGNEYLGFMGAGRFVQRGGTHTTPQTFMGYYTGNGGPVFGSYDLQGGQFQPGSLNVGYTGTGMFTQSGGSNSTGSLTLGNQAGAHGEYRLSGGTLTVTGGLIVGNGGTGTFGVTGPGPTISTGSYAQAATGTLVSEVTATGLAPITVNGQAALNGAWTVLDDAAPFGTFSVLFAKGGISGTFSAISLPGQNWHWGVTGGKTLWVSHDVPEPATALLLAGGALATLRRRARRGPAENAIAGEPRGG